MVEYLENLNKSQREAVENTEGPVMVIAGAGSGKTRVLTYRIAHLINKGIDPFNIMALTFTNKAAREMKNRIATIIGGTEARNIWMGTFHSIFARILRVEADKIGYPSNFSIYDTADSKSLLKSIVKEMGLDDKLYKVGFVQNRISQAKNNLISPKAYSENVEVINDDHMGGRPKIVEIYKEYNRRCFKAGAMDFDDLLYKTNVVLRDFPEVLHKYQHKFKYLLVDEYQDTNYSQYLIVKKLAALNENICVVGDDAQSIYSFRGANIQNILNFRKDYPDFKMFKLEQNYRSTKNIVEAANSIIKNNKDQIQKNVWTSNDTGNKIKVNRSMTDNEEGMFVANEIFSNRSEFQANNKDFAILYRTNAQSRAMEEALRKLNIPYRIYGGLSFYQRKEIKDLLAYFRLTANPNDEEALKRVINYPARGIGKSTIEKVMVTANSGELSMWDVISKPEEAGLEVNAGIKTRLKEFATMLQSFAVNLENISAYDLGEQIAKSSGILRDLYADKSPEGLSRYENIQELLNGLREFSDKADPSDEDKINTMSDFLIDVALLTDADQDDGDDDKVNLMTIHAAKGLEFPFVHVVGLEENLFPSQMALNSRTELEEERRLFYVAVTRAEKSITLSYAMSRYKWGNLMQCEPSRFIEEIDAEFLDMPASLDMDRFDGRRVYDDDFGSSSGRSFNTRKNTYTKPSASTAVNPNITSSNKKLTKITDARNKDSGPFVADPAEKILQGVQVEHEKFGKGKVLTLEGASPNIKATVFFPAVGQKQLLLKFAKLKVIG